MKANEAPDKLYLSKNIYSTFLYQVPDPDDKTAVEYIRTDTLEVKEQLTWQDIRLISEIGEEFMNSKESDTLNEEEYYTEILNRFKAQKGEKV